MTSLFVYTAEFVVIYTSPSWVHLFNQREKGKEGDGEGKTPRKEEQYKNSCATNEKKIRGVISGNYLHKRKKNDTSVLNHTFVEGRLLKATVIWAHREQMQRCGTSLQNNQVPKNQSSFMPSFR